MSQTPSAIKRPETKDATAIPTIAPVLRLCVEVLLGGSENPTPDADVEDVPDGAVATQRMC